MSAKRLGLFGLVEAMGIPLLTDPRPILDGADRLTAGAITAGLLIAGVGSMPGAWLACPPSGCRALGGPDFSGAKEVKRRECRVVGEFQSIAESHMLRAHGFSVSEPVLGSQVRTMRVSATEDSSILSPVKAPEMGQNGESMDQETLNFPSFWSLVFIALAFIVPLVTNAKWKRISLLFSVACLGFAGYMLFKPSIEVKWWAVSIYLIALIIGFIAAWRYKVPSEDIKESKVSLDITGKAESLHEVRDAKGQPVAQDFLEGPYSRKFAVLTIINDGDVDIGNLVARPENNELCFWVPTRDEPQVFASGNKDVALCVGQTRSLVIGQVIIPTNAWAKLTHNWELRTSVGGIGMGKDAGLIASTGGALNIMRMRIQLDSKEIHLNVVANLAFDKDEPIVHVNKN